ncbi:hypothetical protein [Variovorax boronicumulans]|uniref:hypothetical protein n=1 Tax=Variovorax boronicumulans TaxID=436515 RepID=UPI0033932107
MGTDFTFPLALCKAQYSIWLHALQMVETIGARAFEDGIALTRAESDAVMRAGDWHALAAAPLQAFRHFRASEAVDASRTVFAEAGVDATPSRQAVVTDALRSLHVALDAGPSAAPSPRRVHAVRKASATRAKR